MIEIWRILEVWEGIYVKINSMFEGDVEELESLAMRFEFNSLPENLKENWGAAIRAHQGEARSLIHT